MKNILILAAVILATNALSAKNRWMMFKVNHNKTYRNIFEDKFRYQIFKTNLKTIEEHNDRYKKGLSTYIMSTNQFSDMTPEEFINMLKLQVKHKPILNATLRGFSNSSSKVPDSIDWREKGAVLDPRNQGLCGSCWAFAATGALEGQNAIVNKQMIYLSVQQLIDCSIAYYNQGCKGGRTPYAFEYVRNEGIETEESYPFQEKDSSCKDELAKYVLKTKSYVILPADEMKLKQAVGTVGPVAVTICANFFQFYHKGIFNGNCDDTIDGLNHAALAVGYGSEDGQDFWIIKNSWGKQWGESGYIRMSRNVNKCGIIYENSYPVL